MRCIYPDCENTVRTRGLCHGHYQGMRSYVRQGKASEADLEKRGLLLDVSPLRGPALKFDAFLQGSTVRGDGAMSYLPQGVSRWLKVAK